MDPELQTPSNNAELAQILYLLDKSTEWASPGKKTEDFIKKGELDKATQSLNAHIRTLSDLQERLCVVIEEQDNAKSEAA